MSARYRGLTWDHPRGKNALIAASDAWPAASCDRPLIEWSTQPLEGFESHPIAELCARYDIVVLDHPHVGEAIASDCLQPIDAIFEAETVSRIDEETIGPCLQSYKMSGCHWALPLDAATQVMAYRKDLLHEAPQTWDAVERLSETSGQVAMSLAGPHAFLTLLSMAVALEAQIDLRDGQQWFEHNTLVEAYDLLKRLAWRSPEIALPLNPIGILEQMATSNAIVLCPLIYGYVNYALPGSNAQISFRDAPLASQGGTPGSILGGTGIGISKGCTITDALKQHLLWLMLPLTQRRFIPEHDGQPSNRDAWHDPELNKRYGSFYEATFLTLEGAKIRPRYNGYIAFQTRASEYLRTAIFSNVTPDDAAGVLSSMFARSKCSEEALS